MAGKLALAIQVSTKKARRIAPAGLSIVVASEEVYFFRVQALVTVAWAQGTALIRVSWGRRL